MATSVDWLEVRQELKVRRTQLFDRFLKNPGDVCLAIEIKRLDDQILECAEHLQHEQEFQIAMRPTANRDKVIPDSFRTVLHNYLGKPEVKSLAPDGMACIGAQGLLPKAKIIAGKLVPVGQETDWRWEQKEDPRMLDSQVYVYEKQRETVVADASERKSWSAIGVKRLMRESKLSQAPVSNAIKGKAVRRQTLSIIRQAAARIYSVSNRTR